MRLGAIVIDSDNIEKLADFYADLLGWVKTEQINNDEKWLIVAKADYSETPLVFQQNLDYQSPVWPSNSQQQQQMQHLDFYVRMDEYQQKIEHAIKCGASKANSQFSKDWQVMIDPSGHPFCIIPIPNEIYEQRYSK
ncbi:hypothetical protein LJB88_01150 [Erysipelotrichaceae bacterium OttesenSCG-928-M19]|nr:hypothetical protein [Erysipelotrichaceae bacterium OttesenSCG-928-M19]